MTSPCKQEPTAPCKYQQLLYLNVRGIPVRSNRVEGLCRTNGGVVLISILSDRRDLGGDV